MVIGCVIAIGIVIGLLKLDKEIKKIKRNKKDKGVQCELLTGIMKTSPLSEGRIDLCFEFDETYVDKTNKDNISYE